MPLLPFTRSKHALVTLPSRASPREGVDPDPKFLARDPLTSEDTDF